MQIFTHRCDSAQPSYTDVQAASVCRLAAAQTSTSVVLRFVLRCMATGPARPRTGVAYWTDRQGSQRRRTHFSVQADHSLHSVSVHSGSFPADKIKKRTETAAKLQARKQGPPDDEGTSELRESGKAECHRQAARLSNQGARSGNQQEHSEIRMDTAANLCQTIQEEKHVAPLHVPDPACEARTSAHGKSSGSTGLTKTHSCADSNRTPRRSAEGQVSMRSARFENSSRARLEARDVWYIQTPQTALMDKHRPHSHRPTRSGWTLSTARDLVLQYPAPAYSCRG